jgi:microcystin-dependent protein
MLPVGSVILWGLSDKDFPDTFLLCDGGKFVYNGREYTKPDLRGRFALGSGQGTDAQYPAETKTFRLNDYGGEYRHKLSISEMPKHQHYSRRIPHGKVTNNSYYQVNDSSLGHYDNTSYDATEYKSSPTGGDLAHNNMPPYRALHYIIKVKD